MKIKNMVSKAGTQNIYIIISINGLKYIIIIKLVYTLLHMIKMFIAETIFSV